MLVKRTDGISSNTKENLHISTLSHPNNKEWILTDEGWIMKSIETSNNEVSND